MPKASSSRASRVFLEIPACLYNSTTHEEKVFYFFYKICLIAIFDVLKIETRLKPRALFSHNVVLKNFVRYFKDQNHC